MNSIDVSATASWICRVIRQSCAVRNNDHERWYPGEQQGIVPQEMWDRVQAQLNSNHQHRKNLDGRSSSLLVGLMEDGTGNRLTPTFTVKNGKRYHYYVSERAIRGQGSQDTRPTRLPGYELEKQATNRLHAFLNSGSDLLDQLNPAGKNAETIQQLVTAAKRLAGQWPSLKPAEIRRLFRSFVSRVVIRESVEFEEKKGALERAFSAGWAVSYAALPAAILCPVEV